MPTLRSLTLASSNQSALRNTDFASSFETIRQRIRLTPEQQADHRRALDAYIERVHGGVRPSDALPRVELPAWQD